MSEFKAGDRVYTSNGRVAEFVSEFPGNGVIVRLAFERDDEADPFYFDGIVRVDRVYSTAPREVYDEQIKKLETRRDELRASVTKLTAENEAAMKGTKELMANISRIDAFQRIDDFIAGRMTHFVVATWNDISIQTKDEVIRRTNDRGDWRGDLKLLTLFGDTKGNLAWGLDTHHIEGVATRVYPCMSFEDAWKKASKMLEDAFLAFEVERLNSFASEIKSAERLGIPIPARILVARREAHVASLKAKADKAEAEAREAVAAFKAAFDAE